MDASFQRYKFTAVDVLRMVETGLLSEDAPIELIDGELCVMSPQGPPHRMTVVRVRRCLEAAFGAGFYVQDHSPVAAGPDSLPEPDIAVVREPERFDAHPGPSEVVLVVEISRTSQREDRAKAAVYAAAGFAEYWNLDLSARRLVVYREPHPADREYGLVAIHRDGEDVPVASTRVAVRALLPPQDAEPAGA